MSDNFDTQSVTPATAPANLKVATRGVTYSGDPGAQIAPVGLVAFSGPDEGKTATDLEGATAAPAADAAGLVVRTPKPNLDTGYGEMSHTGTLAAAPTIATNLAFLLDGIWLVNPSGADINVQITNGSDQAIFPTQQVPGRSHLALSCLGKPTTGLKWNASAAGLFAQAWGRS